MMQDEQDRLHVVRDYHERTKHRLDRYAPALGFLDWDNQPDPFRRFDAAEQIALPHPAPRDAPTYDSLFADAPEPAGLDADLVGRLFYHSLALSAWKQVAQARPWSLRVNPSSGALHPTEGYLVCGKVTGLIDEPGVFHYAPFRHGLERRCRLAAAQWQALVEGLPDPSLLLGLSSIFWRESWKYGERAFRYCHLDVGHALGAIAYAACLLGWEVRLLQIADMDQNRLLGTDRQSGIEAEHADCLLALYPADASPVSAKAWQLRVPDAAYAGAPNRLSAAHHDWPVIEEVARATRAVAGQRWSYRQASVSRSRPPVLIADRGHAAERIIRQRRSAVAMDAVTVIDRGVFYQMLQRLLPARFPFDVLPWTARVSLVIFVHRVAGLEPGLYLLAREDSHEATLRKRLNPKFEWCTPEACPPGLRLYRLQSGDLREAAWGISCHQAIASDGAFSVGMLSEFEDVLAAQGAACYPQLYWECGLIGQVLYLEAEAAGMRGTGIGCFFDDVMHDLLGLGGSAWQDLYHFTVGGAIEDPRLRTIPAYAHLAAD